MDTARGRQITVLDVMILTAATALGLWLARTYYTAYEPGYPFPVISWVPDPPLEPEYAFGVGEAPPADPAPAAGSGFVSSPISANPPQTFSDRFRHWTQCPLLVVVPALPLLISWSLALPILLKAREGLGLRPMAGRPEAWVGIAVAAVVAVRSAGFATFLAVSHWIIGSNPWYEAATDMAWTVLLSRYPFATPTEVGWIVAMAWVALLLRRRWRRTPGYIGWMGLALGIAWISFLPLFYCWIGLPAWFSN